MDCVQPLQLVEMHLTVNGLVTEMAFVYGIGLQGLVPFEQLIERKAVGQLVCVSLRGHARQAFFGHLQCQVTIPADATVAWAVSAEIKRVSKPSDRMIVDAMAHMSACEHNGCGGHGCCG